MSLDDLFPATRRSVRNTRDDVVATRADISELRQRIDTLQEQNALLLKRLESTYNRVVQTDCGINERLTTEFNNTWDRIDTNAAHNTIRFHALYARDGEEARETRRRLIASVEPAQGDARLVQLCCARLMSELDQICRENGIRYWLSWGTLISSLCRNGFFPWDDDIDIAMPRADVDKLITAVKDHPAYQVTICYDWYVLCKQIRFSRRDGAVPSFIDIAAFDWSTGATESNDATMRQLRGEMMGKLRSLGTDDGPLSYWAERKYLYAPGSGAVAQVTDEGDPDTQDIDKTEETCLAIETIFKEYRDKAYEAGTLCDEDAAQSLCYTMDGMSDAGGWMTTCPWNYPVCDIYPTRTVTLEGFDIQAPADPKSYSDMLYPGWPFLPSGADLHRTHFDVEKRINATTRKSMNDFIAGKL
ncbi:hypothetical protein EP30_08725 [Bifidobacterium sp. UTCIF-39]|uniref:LicD family protein n=1 Tax=Bifidobacterium sp. UTCIF-39 TaxID=1465359 RepID=UPI00112E197E|nr:LicD family protein [Bifidobacterium sp. UTCIF-39]TPF96201.1 hypothetical protein EP30_08725 [Bifidobacterium sp. UTCIF-39]